MANSGPPIYFVRHGETQWNKLGLIQGWTDVPLNDTGHAQARAMGKALVSVDELKSGFQHFVSPMLRARQTMGHIAEALNIELDTFAIEPSVKELGFGVWEGKTVWELKASPIYPADPETRFGWQPRGGESYAEGFARMKAWYDTLTKPAFVVAHGAIGRCLIGMLTGLGPAEIVGLPMIQGRYCRIENGKAQWFDAMAAAA